MTLELDTSSYSMSMAKATLQLAATRAFNYIRHSGFATTPTRLLVKTLLLLLPFSLLAAPFSLAPVAVDVTGISGQPLPIPAPKAKATVLIFVSSTCPIANVYAPEISRIHSTYAPKNVAFRLVYIESDLTPDACRKHHEEYAHSSPALQDPQHRLVALAGVSITPEVAVLPPTGFVRYRGRIDDRFPKLGVRRRAPTHTELRDVLDAILADKPLPVIQTQAVGCLIE